MIAMLSIALFPIGLIAVSQTAQVANAQRETSELALLTRTEKASFEERIVIEQARGAARLLGTLQDEFDDQIRCEEYLRAFVAANTRFSFIGVLPKTGVMECSSSGRTFDFSRFENFNEAMASETANVTVNQEGPLSGTSVIVVSEPFYELGVFQGMITVSVPHSALPTDHDRIDFAGLVNVMTFNAQGDILTSSGNLDSAYLDAPVAQQLGDLVGREAFSFSGKDKLQQDRIYSIVPIIDDAVYTLGVWDARSALGQRYLGQFPPWIFPTLMWLASLLVALFAVHRLVIRHIRQLGRKMKAFAEDRTLPPEDVQSTAPAELADIEHDFSTMASIILRDEAESEDNLRDKNVLLKEVHHRVKNNLQLISSIMNMQRRRAKSSETKEVLAKLQDRVLSLATIHRDLYQSQTGGRVNAGDLVMEIVEKSVEIGEDINANVIRSVDVDPILLYPDQAVPLSLLVAEASANAMKYLRPDQSGKEWVNFSLKVQDGQTCRIKYSNSTSEDADAESTGLGSQLINAFAMQLGGQLTTDHTADKYEMALEFAITDFTEESGDY